MAAVLKTVDLNGFGGSNPSLSAEMSLQVVNNQTLAAISFLLATQIITQNFSGYVQSSLSNSLSN
jgi:hypothetical protein